MILNLPDIVKQSMTVFVSLIISNYFHSMPVLSHSRLFDKFQSCNDHFVDDEMFLHLLRKSSGKIFIDCQYGAITKAAITKAFEVIFHNKNVF